MRCAKCGADLIPGKRFCPACGEAATLACTGCGASLDAGFRFCPDCGVPVDAGQDAAPAPPSPPAEPADQLARLSSSIPAALADKVRASQGAIAGERKLVSVLFCDLVGSTALAERLDPEEYRDLLDQYLELSFREIYRVEGIVNQLAGDGLMALFGAPIAHEDGPHRAVLAALSIRDGLGELAESLRVKHGFDLSARIGIHTGLVVVGTVGNDLKMDYTAIGDTTNLASRLQSLAEPGTILMSEPTHRLVLGFFEARSVGPFTVKGKQEPVAAYEVLSRQDSATPMGVAVARGLTPLVGRREELAHMRACFDRLTGHMAQVVTLVGDDGSGKSRLLYEFKQTLAGVSVVFLEGRCSSLTRMVPYAPFTSMLRAFFNINSGASTEQVCSGIDKLSACDPELERIHPFLSRLLAAPTQMAETLGAEEVQRETFEAVARLVIAISVRTPVVMVVEDLQWIDESSRGLLELALSRLPNARVMLILSHRSEYEPVLRTQATFTRLFLTRLSDTDTGTMITAIAGGHLPTELEQRILIKSEGNPFFAEELTRALVEEGLIVRSDDGVRLSRPIAEITIPDTVQELISARLDRLGAHAKRVVQVASALGRQFERTQLTDLLADDGIDATAELAALERRGIIHRKTVHSDEEYRFGESLTQDVAYETLLLKERRQLHGRIARILQSTPGDPTAEQSALVAHHLSLSDDRPMAIEAILRAARDAEQVPSYRTATELYQQAWELAEEEIASDGNPHSLRWALQGTLGICRMAVLYSAPTAGDIDRAATRGRELAEQVDDPESLAFICSLHGMHMCNDRERFADGVAVAECALEVARRAELGSVAVRVSRGLAYTYAIDGRFEEARRISDWVVSEFVRSGEAARSSDFYFGALFMRDSVRLLSDDLSGAIEGTTQTYNLAVEKNNRTVEVGCVSKLAYVHLLRGEYATADEWARRGLEVAEEIDSLVGILTGAAVALLARAATGEASGLGRYVMLLDRALPTRHQALSNGHLVVEALLAAREIERAEQVAELAYRQAGGRLREALSASALGAVMLARGPQHWDAARRWYNQAIQIADSIGARSVLAGAQLGMARIADATGDRRQRDDRLTPVIAIADEVGLGHYRKQAERLVAGGEAPLHGHA
jgi:class 3 adenylate cyclase